MPLILVRGDTNQGSGVTLLRIKDKMNVSGKQVKDAVKSEGKLTKESGRKIKEVKLPSYALNKERS